jgi:hypothetical protein
MGRFRMIFKFRFLLLSRLHEVVALVYAFRVARRWRLRGKRGGLLRPARRKA